MKKRTTAEIRLEMERNNAEQARRFAQQLDVGDSALSSWGSSATERTLETELKLAERGWLAWFPCLLDAKTGERVNAKVINSRYGRCWMILPDRANGPRGFCGLTDHAMAAKGYKGGWEQAPAHAKFKCAFLGDCGSVDIVRDADGATHGLLDRPEDPAPGKPQRRKPRRAKRVDPLTACRHCDRYFNLLSRRCTKSEAMGECDCPRCQGLCSCKPRPVRVTEAGKRTRCADCGAEGERTGHQTCPYPQDH